MPHGVLTTPVVYLSFEPVDPFKRTVWTPRRLPFLYHVTTFLIIWVMLCLLTFVMAHNAPSIALLQRHGFSRWGLLPAIADFSGRKRDHTIYGRSV